MGDNGVPEKVKKWPEDGGSDESGKSQDKR